MKWLHLTIELAAGFILLFAVVKTEQWMAAELQKQGIISLKDVLIAEWLEGDGLFVQTYQPAERQRPTRRQTASK
ncbi:hypothetical protein [Geobacillus sp. TFV-3]|uniref:hypothetical protein n=1 Tax=Geobacillus sp. TFV-3 TaxID=1897059 RepID=UPI001F223734|nr:hypothetical protein [Geobacillus sp. TFV-3]KAF0995013.1 hypothetical protein BJQ97_01662 [Geobacillus sp. TFV-3]